MQSLHFDIPGNNNPLLFTNISLAVDEANINRLITTAENEITRLECSAGELYLINILRDEISFLEGKLAEIRNLAGK